MNRDISPPPTKKRRLEEEPLSSHSDDQRKGDTLTVYSWNINGITPFIQRPITSFFQTKQSPNRGQTKQQPEVATASLRDFLRRQSWPTLLLLQEVKINPSDTSTIRAVERAVRSPAGKDLEPDYQAFFTLPTDPYNARGFGRKVYGVCTLVRADFLSSTNAIVRTVDWDLEGRISITETPGGPTEPKLSIWNIYAVNGTSNAYKNPTTGGISGTRHDRKLAFHKHLLEECLKLEREGYKVILAGDMNIARSAIDGFPDLRTFPEQHVRNRADFNDKFFDGEDGFRGVDTFRFLHGEKRAYTYYPHGRPFGSSCDRVSEVWSLLSCSDCLF